MNEHKKIIKHTEKILDLMHRGRSAYPIQQDQAYFKKRYLDGDKNIAAYLDDSGCIDHYELKFTTEQKQDLERAYWTAVDKKIVFDDSAAIVFVGILESWARSIPDYLKIAPPSHKERQRSIDSFIKGIEKIDTALAGLDSAALGWLYAKAADKLSEEGIRISPDDGEIVSMKNHPIQAQVEAGELRNEFRRLAKSLVEAATDARETLPQSERIENDPRMTMAKALERQIIENGIDFSITESGFPAQCLRAVFELGGLEIEKVGYWLKKAADDPDSYARFRRRMQEKTEGKNLPGL